MEVGAQLRELARNLYWTWQPDVIGLFRSLDPELWRAVNHNPVAFLARLSPEDVHAKAAEQVLEARISFAFHRLRDYLGDRRTWSALNAGTLRPNPVAYFSAEFGLHESLPIYSGGLGVLAGDHLKSASDLGLPLVGVGLLYAQGYFNQVLDRDGLQTEVYRKVPIEHLPLERATNGDGSPLTVKVQTRSSTITLGLWRVPVGRCTLLLLDSDVPENAPADRRLTTSLYGGDQNTRIRQEMMLGVGGLRALRAVGVNPGVLHLNEGHSVFALLEQARHLMERDARRFDEVKAKVAGSSVFTTHTPVEAGHDRFPAPLVEEVLGPLRDSLGLSYDEFMGLGRVRPDDRNEPFCMTVLGLKMAAAANGVSALHGRVSRAMWHVLWPERAESAVPIGHITNGVHVSSWLSPDMANLFTRYLRQGWHDALSYRETWEPVERIPDVEFWEAQQILKVRLINYVRRTVHRQAEARGDSAASRAAFDARLTPDSLTIGFARRFATYKRHALLLDDLDQLDELVNDPKRPVQIIYAGKAHPADEPGKRLLQRVCNVARDPRFSGRIIFLEDHDMNLARHLIQGVDVWMNNPRRPLEACGTSGQKAMLNGGLNLSVLDGWWAEAYDGMNGFAIGEGGEHSKVDAQDRRDAHDAMAVLREKVVPLYYDRDARGVPAEWVQRQKHAIRTLAWRFNADRMVMDYACNSYLPAAGGMRCSGMPFAANPSR